MPHAELSYSADLRIDAWAMLAEIERVIQRLDPGAGECKGRAYPAAEYHHSHLLLSLTLLRKPHRDEVYTRRLMTEVEAAVKAMIPESCFFSFALDYNGEHYVTNRHEVGR